MPARELQLADITALSKQLILPSSVLVEVCHTCNENCIHCCLSQHSKRGLTLAQYDNLFDQMVQAGTFYVILTGGEPFTRADFMEIVESARKRRLSTSIFTNGNLINKEQIARLRDLYVDEVHVSIYCADPQIHDAVTRIPCSFEKSVAAIQEMLRVGMAVRIKCPLMNMTAGSIDETKQLAADLGVNVQYTLAITAKNNGDCDTHKCRLTQDQLHELISDPDVVTQSTKPVHFMENLDCIPCDTVFNGGAIDPDGNVYVCNQWSVIGGNILEKPLLEIWRESPKFNRIRGIRLRDLKKCGSCDLFRYCTRCPGLAQLEDDDVYGCSSIAKVVAEERKKAGVFPTEAHIFSQSIGKKDNHEVH
ncbi:MAG: radical SAM protein [Nitrospirae bacterium]|nr:radical SAM protein [Nitrospirota bacterium]